MSTTAPCPSPPSAASATESSNWTATAANPLAASSNRTTAAMIPLVVASNHTTTEANPLAAASNRTTMVGLCETRWSEVGAVSSGGGAASSVGSTAGSLAAGETEQRRGRERRTSRGLPSHPWEKGLKEGK